MALSSQKAKGPASVGALPSHGSTNPRTGEGLNMDTHTTEYDRIATATDFASMDSQPWAGDPSLFPLTVDQWQRKTHTPLMVAAFSHRLMHVGVKFKRLQTESMKPPLTEPRPKLAKPETHRKAILEDLEGVKP